MPRIAYSIERAGAEWRILRNGEDAGSYLSQEAAFESAAAFAGGDLRTGHDIVIEAGSPTDPRGASVLGGSPKTGDGFS